MRTILYTYVYRDIYIYIYISVSVRDGLHMNTIKLLVGVASGYTRDYLVGWSGQNCKVHSRFLFSTFLSDFDTRFDVW